MNILEGVKPTKAIKSQKFVIKPKTSVREKQNVKGEIEGEAHATDDDVHQFLQYMVNKSKRYRQLIQEKIIESQDSFSREYLHGSACIRTLLKATLDQLLADRRLGKNLKGINKSLLQEIQNAIWHAIQREISLYQLQITYQKQKLSLQKELQNRRQQLEAQIQQLKE